MGRETDDGRVEAGEREDETRVESSGKRFVFVGAPGVGKRALAEALQFDGVDASIRPEPMLSVAPVGLQSDYRTELLVASHRASAIWPTEDVILLHSLVDSVAYAVYNTGRLAKSDGVNAEMTDAYTWATGAIMWMFRHSLRYDHVFLLKREDLDPEWYDFQTLLEEVLNDNDISYTVLEGDKKLWPEQAKAVMEGYATV